MKDETARCFSLGWRLMPIKGKIPFVLNWQNAHLTEEEFEAQYRSGNNVGVVTGWLKDKLGLMAVDVDQPELLGFDPTPFIEKGAMSHTTSVADRLVFYTDAAEVVQFSRKVTRKMGELSERECQLLNKKAEGKESVVILEVLGEGRQFMCPPSRHPETRETLKWIVPPQPPEETLVVHGLDEFKALMEKCVTRARWVLEDLFETARSGVDPQLLSEWLDKIRSHLSEARETANYIMFHCPFHPPDDKPSFVIHKTKFYAYDYHDDQAYSLKALAEKLGVNLLGVEIGKREPIRKKGKKATKQEEPTLVDQLIDIALSSNIQLFEDDRGDAYAILEGGGHQEIHRIESKVFERWLRKKYFELEQKGLRKETLNDASATLAAIAQFQKPSVKRKLHNRVAWHDNSIYYDLSGEKWRAVKICANGWEIVDEPPPLFRHFLHQQAQIAPVKGGSLDELFTFINVIDPKDQLLVKVLIVVMLVPDMPHPILLVLGPQGCGKSGLMRALRKLVDPSAILLQSFRYDRLEMALKVFHHYVVYFDNLSSIKQWLSDILCRACTGQGFTKRRLYTDEDSVIFQFQRCVGINGIALSRLSPDFLDRCLTLTLKQIPSDKRKHEKELWKEFEEARPRIFGAVLDTLSKAMRIYPTVEIEHLPRMADFAMWGEAVSRALGYKPGKFLDAYREKIGEQVTDVLEQNPIGIAILAFMENREKWKGTPSDLLESLEDIEFVKEHKIDVEADKWPGSTVWVTRRIREIETNLEHEGIKFSTRYEKRRRVITLTKCNGNNGNNGISPTKKGKTGDVQHHLDDVGSKKVSARNTVNTVVPLQSTDKEEKETPWEWDGFHVIGPYPPDVAYKKTVNSIRELQKTKALTTEDIEQVIAYYWTKESHSKVWDHLVKDGVIAPNVRERQRDSGDVASRLRSEWTEDLTEEEILKRLVKLGLTPREAKHFFEDHLAGKVLFWHDHKDGKTVWKWA